MSDIALRMTLVDDVSNKLNKIATSGKNVATQLATAGKEIEKAFQTKSPDTFVSKVGKAMSEAEKEVESLGSTIDSIDDSFSSKSGHWDISNSGMTWIDDVAEQAEEAGKSMDKASNSAKKLKDGLSGVGDDADGLSDVGDDAEELGESMSSASGQVVDFSGALKTLFGVAVGAKVFGEVKDYISNSIEVGKDYTSMISEVAAISGATGSDLDLMEESARKWGATTVFSASDAAEALKYMSLAGWSAQQSTSALGGVLNLAAASGMGLGEASDMVTDYLSAFGMEASKSAYFADMLAYAQSNSNTTAAQLGEAYRNSAANLHAAGQDVETTTSLLEAMANQGYKGSEAGTALAATMRDITQKMEDGNIQIGDTSVAVQDSQGNFRDLTDILMDVENATDGMGDAQKAAALGSTFTSDSIKALNMILTEGMDKVSGYEKALRSASGTSDQMAGTMNDNLSGDMANMQSALEEMQLQSFEALEEPLRGFVQYATNDVIPTLTEWVPEAVGSLADGVSELGQALSPIFETIIKNPEAVGNAFISMAAGLTALKAVNTGFKIADKVTELGGMTNALSKFGTMLFGNPWAAGAAATVAALTAVGLAIHSYNKQQVQDSLSERFGDIELTSSQIKDSAEHIINGEFQVQYIKDIDNEFSRTKYDTWCLYLTHYVYRKFDANGETTVISDTRHSDEWLPEGGAIRTDGTIRPFVAIAKYMASEEESRNAASVSGGIPGWYEAKSNNAKPNEALVVWHEFRNYSFASALTHMREKGTQYCAETTQDSERMTRLMEIAFATKHSRSVMAGCNWYWYQCPATVQETDVERIIISKSNAKNLVIGSTVSIGNATALTSENKPNLDRGQSGIHAKANRVTITKIEDYDDNNSAVYVDNHGKTFSTASTIVSGVTCDTYISTMPWNTGGCDNVLGTCGSPTSNTSGKEPYILFGVEMSSGFWEPKGNTVVKIENHVMRVYICYDCTKMTTAGATTADWVAVGYEIPDCKESWKYIAKLGYDADNPEVRYPVAVGATSSTGYACACYTNNLETTGDGQREILGSGYLGGGSYDGRRLAFLSNGLSNSHWNYAARLSASGRCGRKAA